MRICHLFVHIVIVFPLVNFKLMVSKYIHGENDSLANTEQPELKPLLIISLELNCCKVY